MDAAFSSETSNIFTFLTFYLNKILVNNSLKFFQFSETSSYIEMLKKETYLKEDVI